MLQNFCKVSIHMYVCLLKHRERKSRANTTNQKSGIQKQTTHQIGNTRSWYSYVCMYAHTCACVYVLQHRAKQKNSPKERLKDSQSKVCKSDRGHTQSVSYTLYRCVSISRTSIRPDFDKSDEFSGTGTFLLILHTLTRIRNPLIRTFIGL